MNRSLRFCMITTFYPPYNFGGDGIFAHRLTNELARRGHAVDIIHCIDAYRSLARQEPAGSYDDHPNVTVHGLRSGFGFLSPLATQQTGLPIFKSDQIGQILKQGFDVIHYHNISLVGGPGILTYGQGVKLYTMHEYWLVCPTHVLFRFNRAVCMKPRCFLCNLTYRRPPQGWRYGDMLGTAIQHVDAFIAPSRFSKDKHRQMGLDIPIVHLPNFVPEAEIASSSSEEEVPEGPYFLFVGRLEKLKGPQTLIPIFRRYRKAQLWIAGTGKDEHRLRQLAADSPYIRFLGYRQDLWALYRGAAAVIVPSIVFEVFPLVIIEAFREQTPVIARNLGGMPEIIEESGGGFTFDTEDELVAAMDRLLEDPSYRDQLGTAGYQAYRQQWTADAHMERYFALIDSITSRAARQF